MTAKEITDSILPTSKMDKTEFTKLCIYEKKLISYKYRYKQLQSKRKDLQILRSYDGPSSEVECTNGIYCEKYMYLLYMKLNY